MDFSHLSGREQAAIQSTMDEMQERDMLKMFNSLADRCFARCVNTFRGSRVNTEEKECVLKCAEKYMRFQQRAMKAYLEEQQRTAEELARKQMSTSSSSETSS
jgi:import inner membrane translocase subunit TIM9